MMRYIVETIHAVNSFNTSFVKKSQFFSKLIFRLPFTDRIDKRDTQICEMCSCHKSSHWFQVYLLV